MPQESVQGGRLPRKDDLAPGDLRVGLLQRIRDPSRGFSNELQASFNGRLELRVLKVHILVDSIGELSDLPSGVQHVPLVGCVPLLRSHR